MPPPPALPHPYQKQSKVTAEKSEEPSKAWDPIPAPNTDAGPRIGGHTWAPASHPVVTDCMSLIVPPTGASRWFPTFPHKTCSKLEPFQGEPHSKNVKFQKKGTKTIPQLKRVPRNTLRSPGLWDVGFHRTVISSHSTA